MSSPSPSAAPFWLPSSTAAHVIGLVLRGAVLSVGGFLSAKRTESEFGRWLAAL